MVRARASGPLSVLEQVQVGEERLAGEVIAIRHDVATIQVYEETNGLRPGEPLYGTGAPLSVLLGPGLLASTYDGLQRPLAVIRDEQGIYLRRGSQAQALPEKAWHFTPRLKAGEAVRPGSVVGVVQETPLIEHRVLIPSGVEGTLIDIASPGAYTVHDVIATLRDAGGGGPVSQQGITNNAANSAS